jgi:ferredoxin
LIYLKRNHKTDLKNEENDPEEEKMELKMRSEKSGQTVVRNIIKIDETLCNGCGKCISPCAEGAIEIVDGKAKVISEELCDGLGACLQICPTGALTIEKREAAVFDEEKAGRHQKKAAALNENEKERTCFVCGKNDEENYLIQVLKNGQMLWICTKCLPNLIHK